MGKLNSYGTFENIMHWILTIMCWFAVIVLLIYFSNKKLGFNILNENKVNQKGIILSIILMAICIVLNVYDWGNLKIICEFKQSNVIEFIFQYVYYIFEIGLVFLIVAFGQKFSETILNRESRIPFGGIILCCTWGMIHILSKQSIYTGLGVMIFSIIYGLMYVFFNKNTKYSYIAMLLAFII